MKGVTIMAIWTLFFAMVGYHLPNAMEVPLFLALFPWGLWLVGAINPTFKVGDF